MRCDILKLSCGNNQNGVPLMLYRLGLFGDGWWHNFGIAVSAAICISYLQKFCDLHIGCRALGGSKLDHRGKQ